MIVNMDMTLLNSYFNLEKLDSLVVTMGEGGIGAHLLNVALGLVMFGVALGLKPENFVNIIKNPKSILTGIICQIVVLPALTFLLVIACSKLLSVKVALGMILVAACPGGNVSNFITSLSRGNSELSVSLTAFNTAACIITTPINFAFWGKMYLNYVSNHNITELHALEVPFWEIFQSIVIIMGIPLILGMLCAQYYPRIAQKLKKPLQRLSIVVFVAMVVIIFASNFDAFLDCIASIFIIVLVHNLLALGIGFGSGTLMKLPYKDRRTLTIETGIQNSGLGLILLMNPNIFPTDHPDWMANGGMVVITAWWGVWHIISGFTLSYLWRIKGRKEACED